MDGLNLVVPPWVDLLYPIVAMNMVLIALALFLVFRDHHMSTASKFWWTVLTVFVPIVGGLLMVCRNVTEDRDS